jgi:hypothetical protein
MADWFSGEMGAERVDEIRESVRGMRLAERWGKGVRRERHFRKFLVMRVPGVAAETD